MLKDYLKLSLEVKTAQEQNIPIVALESTVIAHGLPYPDNVEVTFQMMDIIRKKGCVPAVILIEGGAIQVGIDEAQIESLAYKVKTAEKTIYKASIADITLLLAQKLTGATTVASTAYCAYEAGIKIFATGGVGGVHRGAETTFDISTDLVALKTIPVAVVSAGVKSILDISKTLEVLETYGVPILGYKTRTFPTFYCQSSDYALSHFFENIADIATIVRLQLSTQKGLLVVNPIPEADSLEKEQVEDWISQALHLSEKEGIVGKSVTPFLLQKLSQFSEGKTLTANKALLLNNAEVASQLAACL